MKRTPDLEDAEMVEILKGIARSGTNAAARIAAVKELRAMQKLRRPVEEKSGLYDAANPGRVRKAS